MLASDLSANYENRSPQKGRILFGMAVSERQAKAYFKNAERAAEFARPWHAKNSSLIFCFAQERVDVIWRWQ